MKYGLTTALLFSLTVSCETPPGVEKIYRIRIKNNSGKPIYFHRSTIYPDTTIRGEYLADGHGYILPNSTAPIDSKIPWREKINMLPSDTVSIILFDPDTIKQYGWDRVRNEHLYLKRWNIDADYLEHRAWTLIYPE